MPDNDKPKPKRVAPPISQEDLIKFSNWTDQTDTKLMAKDLMKRGLTGADQLYFEGNPNFANADAVRKAQNDWKVSALREILSNARRFNLRTPQEVMANKNALVTNPMWRDAINNPFFSHVHPNWWQVISESILPERYAKFEQQPLLAKK